MAWSFGVRLIILLIVIGGLVAYIGDYLGRQIGRRRLTLFNLRPRHTAIAITILSGIFIALTTLLTLLVVSQNTRTALFGLEQLEQKLQTTQSELVGKSAELGKIDQALLAAQQGIRVLSKNKKKLEQAVETSRQGNVLFKVGDVVTISLIQAGPESDKLELGLQEILTAAPSYNIYVEPAEFKRAVTALTRRQGEQIILARATRNALIGEEVLVKFEIMENKLIYRAEEEISRLNIPARLTLPQIEQEIKNLLLLVNQQARQAGIVADPSGVIGSLPYSEIYDQAKKIKGNNKNVLLKVLAKNDIYALGPLSIKFLVTRP